MNLTQQRYWQYSFQFIDYNSNFDDDLWDENWDWKIIWDDDDEFLWTGPSVFDIWKDLKEIYLISWDKKTRTYIRWNVLRDPNSPSSSICNNNWSWALTWVNFDWCIWTIEFLKLEWVDWWMDHNSSTPDTDWTQNDWVIDTWLIDRQFTWWVDIVAWSNSINYWRPLFPTNISVVDFKVFAYPNVETKHFWKDPSASTNISPYLVLNFKIKPSWETRKKIKKDSSPLNFNVTINLTDIFSK